MPAGNSAAGVPSSRSDNDLRSDDGFMAEEYQKPGSPRGIERLAKTGIFRRRGRSRLSGTVAACEFHKAGDDMKNHSSSLAVCVAVLTLGACANTAALNSPPAKAVGAEPRDVERWADRVGWFERERGGAAIQENGYQHVLAITPRREPALTKASTGDEINETIAAVLERLKGMEAKVASRPDAPTELTVARAPVAPNASSSEQPAPAALNDRQKQAWKRFCDGAKTMTADDWQIVHATGGPPWNLLDHYLDQDCAALRNDHRHSGVSLPVLPAAN